MEIYAVMHSTSNDLVHHVELINTSDRFFILKASKALAKINVKNNTQITISLDLIEFGRKRRKKLILDRNM
jgi:hypothetical protein